MRQKREESEKKKRANKKKKGGKLLANLIFNINSILYHQILNCYEKYN